MQAIAGARWTASAILTALLLVTTNAAAQYVLSSAVATGPSGSRAHPGETITVRVFMASFLEFGDCASINDISLIIHHRDGDVLVPNMLSEPLYLMNWGDSAEVSTNFTAHCDDPGILSISYTMTGMIYWGGPVTGGPAGVFSVQFGTQLVLDQAMPLTVARVGTNTVQVSWPASPCCRLEVCDAMDGLWRTVSTPPKLIEGAYSMGFNTTSTKQQFYRLTRYQADPPLASGRP
jgi:hypothetical protein